MKCYINIDITMQKSKVKENIEQYATGMHLNFH